MEFYDSLKPKTGKIFVLHYVENNSSRLVRLQYNFANILNKRDLCFLSNKDLFIR